MNKHFLTAALMITKGSIHIISINYLFNYNKNKKPVYNFLYNKHSVNNTHAFIFLIRVNYYE